MSYLYTLDALDWTIFILYFGLLSILAIYGLYRLRITYLFLRYHSFQPKPKSMFSEDSLPRVTVQLPLFNEMYVVERLLAACAALDYPKDKLEIQILDDSVDETQAIAKAAADRYAAEGLDIVYLHRTNRAGFKAGALGEGLAVAKGEFILIFDADFQPKPDCIRKMIHYFTEPRVGVVQFRWSHLNADYNLLTRVQSVMLDGHFVIEHTARHRSGGFFNFNGTAGMWRREAIEWSGGWQADTLAEDTDLSYRAQLLGWKFVYVLDEDVPAELPVDINAFKVQQRRWAKGYTQVALKILPRLGGLSLPLHAKIETFFHLSGNFIYPLMILFHLLHFPVLIVRYNQGLFHLMLLDMPFLVLSTFSVTSYYFISLKELHGRRWKDLLMIYLAMSIGVGISISNAKAVLEALLGIQSGFIRTPKYAIERNEKGHSWQRKKYRRTMGWLPLLEIAMTAYFLLTIAYAIHSEMWGVLPFLSIFVIGYGYVGVASLLNGLGVKSARPAAGSRLSPVAE
ncbi:MAG: glycosyl transferase family 2 [Chloracidobacterium sp. CP2_5A]|nr:MAG: glycosyl transferase family 2 [Chloracidobacterium sp. CP2_5A]